VSSGEEKEKGDTGGGSGGEASSAAVTQPPFSSGQETATKEPLPASNTEEGQRERGGSATTAQAELGTEAEANPEANAEAEAEAETEAAGRQPQAPLLSDDAEHAAPMPTAAPAPSAAPTRAATGMAETALSTPPVASAASLATDPRFASMRSLAESLRRQSSGNTLVGTYHDPTVTAASQRMRRLTWANLPTTGQGGGDEDPGTGQGTVSMRRFLGPGPMGGAGAGDHGGPATVALNEKALAVIRRVQDKLTGRDFPRAQPRGGGAMAIASGCGVEEQVDMLIRQATSNERLCQCFIGWCPFW